MRGTGLRRDDWIGLFNDEEHGGLLVPILALANEHHPDPEMRPLQGAHVRGETGGTYCWGGHVRARDLSLLCEAASFMSRGAQRRHAPTAWPEGQTERPVSMWVWKEVQDVLRAGDVALITRQL
jgi:hypothetical protein